MESKENNITVDLTPIPLSPVPQNQQQSLVRWDEKNKRRIMAWASLEGATWDDFIREILIYITVPMFLNSVMLQFLSNMLGLIYAIGFIVILLVAIWMMKVVPESRLLIGIRLILMFVGIALGGAL